MEIVRYHPGMAEELADVFNRAVAGAPHCFPVDEETFSEELLPAGGGESRRKRLHSEVDGDPGPRHVAAIDHSRYSPLEEYTVKLRHLPERMTTDEGRRLAIARADFMARFFAELEYEVSGSR